MFDATWFLGICLQLSWSYSKYMAGLKREEVLLRRRSQLETTFSTASGTCARTHRFFLWAQLGSHIHGFWLLLFRLNAGNHNNEMTFCLFPTVKSRLHFPRLWYYAAVEAKVLSNWPAPHVWTVSLGKSSAKTATSAHPLIINVLWTSQFQAIMNEDTWKWSIVQMVF